MTEELGLDFRQQQDHSLFFKTFLLALGPPSPLLKLWVPAALYPGTKQLRREADPRLQSRMEVNKFILPHAWMACRVTTFLPLFRY